MSFNDSSSWCLEVCDADSRPRSISSHHIHHSSSCVCVCVWFHTWLPCCLLTMHVFISSMCVYVCVRCRKTITVRILDREEYNKQSSFYVLLDSPQWRRSRKEKTGVRASQHPESQINGPTQQKRLEQEMLNHCYQRGAIYLFSTAMSSISKKKRRQWNETEVRELLWCLFLFYANLMGETRVHRGCQRNGHFTAGSRAKSCNEIRTAAAFISEVKWQKAALLPKSSCLYRPVDMGLNMHWSRSAAPLCTYDSFSVLSCTENLMGILHISLFFFLTWVYFSSERTYLHPATHQSRNSSPNKMWHWIFVYAIVSQQCRCPQKSL